MNAEEPPQLSEIGELESCFVKLSPHEKRSPEWRAGKEKLRYFTKRMRRRASSLALNPRSSAKAADEMCPILGCNARQFKKHFDDQFRHGMTWENYAVEWEIDHVEPVRKFNLAEENELLKCANYLNTRPLVIPENRKRPKIPAGFVNTPYQTRKNGKPCWVIDLRSLGMGRHFSQDLPSLVERCQRFTAGTLAPERHLTKKHAKSLGKTQKPVPF